MYKMKKLELISNQVKESSNPPILFIHGMWHGAWCWEPYFLPYFKELGYKAYALSLSNHSNSPRKKAFNLLRINDYVNDLKQVVDTFEEPPILVGHSMGGFIVQKYLENNKNIPGAVLMASVPPFGIWNGTISTLKSLPLSFLKANLTLNLKHIINTPMKYKQVLCSDNFDDADIEKYVKKADTESYLAYMDMLGFNLVKAKKVDTPLYIIGADNDHALSVNAVKKTAAKYNTDYKIFSKMGHLMMLESEYKSVANAIDKWIKSI